MSFRTVVIKNRCKLEYSMNYLICRGDNESRINVDEISTIIIQNVGVAITAALLSRLMEGNVKVIFCDPKANPQGELIPYHGAVDPFAKTEIQIAWETETKRDLWSLITREKILAQSRNLSRYGKENAELLEQYASQVVPGDSTNREGHAAKVYFSSCFGNGFSRDDKSFVNACLNYGYSIILSAVNRYVKSMGYLTEIGIHHIGATNPFNLGCDFMEPLRPFVDSKVLKGTLTEDNYKDALIGILNEKVTISGAEMFLDNAIHDYVQSALIALRENNLSRLAFVQYELA
jgi:CRISP-associated protein Cas1